MRKFNVIIDGVSYGVEVEESVEDLGKEIPMEVIEAAQIKTEEKPLVKKVSEEALVLKSPSEGSASRGPLDGHALRSPLPGMIVSFKTSSGAVVRKGQIVLLLEAMKMENEIAAIADGVINFTTVKGATVNTGDVLAYIK